ncbi:protein FAR1-RELATED SEQUENCE 5-like [Euphorbia lathyris]|uniref:protein FAR1-RELATED SEQUENCE 5-like n=1 Tax=Euphorbia lathyris TaxID=212925 RepID=UPI00331335F3
MNDRGEHNEDYHSTQENVVGIESISSPIVSNQTVDEVTKKIFDSLEAAQSFFRQYSKQMGFSFRVRDSQLNKNGLPRMKKWVCEKEGTKRTVNNNEPQSRKRRKRSEIRQECPASFHVKLDKEINKWVVKGFVPMHNHALAPPNHVQFLKSHRSIADGDMTQAKAMHDVGVDFMAHQSGGFQNLGYTPKDMYNNMNVERRLDIQDGDAFITLGFLAAKQEMDPGFFYKYTSKENGQLCNLFWSDSISRLDYSVFGDVVAFDVCYKRNIYCTPVVTLIGVNNHWQSIVFACALLEDEQASSYNWMLRTFLDCMSGKKPLSVVTDGDLAMRAAIREVFTNVKHRLCILHIQRNATNQVRNPNFKTDFRDVMLNPLEVSEFEEKWTSLVSKYGLQNNSWIERMYDDRELWAEAYFKGFFFGGIRTISRCEGFHSFLNDYMNKNLNLLEFVKQFDRALDRIRYNETKADHKALYSNPVCAHVLKVYEKQAAEKYTPNSFEKFQAELNKESLYLVNEPVEHNDNEHIYQLTKWRSGGRKRTVTYNSIFKTIKCSCKHFESSGFPCRHSLCVIKLEEMSCIPDSCFLQRWTKNVKTNMLDGVTTNNISDDVLSMIRYGALTSTCKRMCKFGSKSSTSFKEVTSVVTNIVRRFEQEDHLHLASSQFEEIHDPKNTSTRKCRNCKMPGHTRTTCSTRIGIDHAVVTSNDESDHNDIVSTDEDTQRDVLITQSTQDARVISSQNMISPYGSTEFQYKEVESQSDVKGTSKTA